MPDSIEKSVKLSPKISGSGTIIVGTGLIGKKRNRGKTGFSARTKVGK